MTKVLSSAAMVMALVVPLFTPANAMADPGHGRGHGRGRDRDRRRTVIVRNDTSRRQQTKNEWRNLAFLGGAVGIAGLLTKNNTLTYLGLGGGLYSLNRYEQDRKSQNREQHSRYVLFSRPSFDHNGHHYVRRTKVKNGQKYYCFDRVR